MSASLSFDLSGFEIIEIRNGIERIDVYAISLTISGRCPDCQDISASVHSMYTRHPRDLPCQERMIRLHLLVHRFFCRNPTCPRKTFVEPLPQVVAKCAHRTFRFTKRLAQLGLALGGRAGARLGWRTGMLTSRNTILRVLRCLPAPDYPTPRVMGIDDWAWRKCTSYGTIICDLERGYVVELLPDRDTDTVVRWLQDHPGVEIVTRDRSASYGEAISKGAPGAQQVADRWHLLKNLRDTAEQVLSAYRKYLALHDPPPPEHLQPLLSAHPDPAISTSLSKAAQSPIENRQRRLARYQQVVDLHEKGMSCQDIAQIVGLHSETVGDWLSKGAFPERKTRPVGSKSLRPYLEHIHKRWDEGCHNATQIWRELCNLGYDRSSHSVQDYCARLRQGLVTQTPERAAAKPHIRRYSPKEAAYLLTSWPDKLTDQQTQDLIRMRQAHPAIEEAYNLAQDFIKLLAGKKPDSLSSWMQQALTGSLTPFQTFAAGLHRDLAAVKAGLEAPWSNGRVEGHVNRLKLIKRQMYGRANFDLLSIRVIHPP